MICPATRTIPRCVGTGLSLRTLRNSVVAIVALIGVFLWGARAFAAEPASDATETSPTYGKTPDAAIPYRHFQEPYFRFFETATPFRGTGQSAIEKAPKRAARIGVFAPAGSAPDADLGREMLQGVQLAVEQANAAGGADGVPFELVERVDAGLWGASSNEMVAFKYVDDVLAVIGSIDGANTHIALRVALKMQMPMVNTATTDPTLTETNIPWLLRCMADDRQQGYALADHIVNRCRLTKLVAFRVNDRYGRTGIAEFRDAARRFKAPLRAELRWDRGERDFSRQLDRIAALQPEAIVLWGNASDCAAVTAAIRRRNLPARIFGCDRLVSRSFLREAGAAAEGVVAVATYDPTRDDPRWSEFVRAFKDKFGHQPESFAAHAYDGANILIAAIRRAGLNRARIRDALYECQRYDGVSGAIEFDATLNDVGAVYLATVENGTFAYRPVPYRTLAQSPPSARSPEHAKPAPGEPLKIGCFMPLDDLGQAVVRGARQALADDAARHPDGPPIQLLVRDAERVWGDDAAALSELVFTENVLALIGSTERRGTHLAQMMAAKAHFPIITLCPDDPTITQIPLAWVFRIAPLPLPDDRNGVQNAEQGPESAFYASLGYDAAGLVANRLRAGARSRLTLRNALSGRRCYRGVTGVFGFDPLGNRRECPTGDALGRHTVSAAVRRVKGH